MRFGTTCALLASVAHKGKSSEEVDENEKDPSKKEFKAPAGQEKQQAQDVDLEDRAR